MDQASSSDASYSGNQRKRRKSSDGFNSNDQCTSSGTSTLPREVPAKPPKNTKVDIIKTMLEEIGIFRSHVDIILFHIRYN